MTEKEREKWSEVRAKGKLHFILIYGLLYFGLSVSILYFIGMRFFDYFFDPISFQNSFNNLSFKFIRTLIVFSIGGIIWGWTIWSIKEKSFFKPSELQ